LRGKLFWLKQCVKKGKASFSEGGKGSRRGEKSGSGYFEEEIELFLFDAEAERRGSSSSRKVVTGEVRFEEKKNSSFEGTKSSSLR